MLKLLKNFVFALITLCLVNFAFGSEQKKEEWVIERDGVSVTFGGKNWLSIDVDGIPFSSFSELWFVNQSWNAYYFGYPNSKNLKSSVVADKHKISFDLIGEHEDFVGKQSLELLPGRILRNTISGHITSDSMTRLNYNYLSIHPGWLTGSKYTVTGKDGKTTSSFFPQIPKKLNLETANICKGLTKLNIESIFGQIEIDVHSDLFPISCLDYRNNAWDNVDYFVLLGISDFWYKTQDEISFTIDIKFPEKRTHLSEPSTKISTGIIKDSKLLSADRGWDVIIPTPKQIAWADGEFKLNRKTRLFYTTDIKVNRDKCKEISARFSRILSKDDIRLSPQPLTSRNGGTITFTVDSELPFDNDCEYIVEVTPEICSVSAKTTEGLDLAEKTLRQLIRRDKGQLSIKCASIRDYPSLPFRGIHCFSGKDALKMQLLFFNDIFPALKINKIVYECSYLKWKSNQYLRNKTYGMDIADVKKVIVAAKKQNIEMIPMINTYGHSEWLLNYPEMKQYADDPDNIYAYDATNPKVYDICSAIYDECIKLFSPKVIHIGHDEIQGRNFPKREKGKLIGSANLIKKDTLFWHKYLKDRGIRTMMWGDMLLYLKESPDATNALSQKEATELREALPKDIIFTDWHYAPAAPSLYKSLSIFNMAGFDTIAATWYTPENITNFTHEAYIQSIAKRNEKEGRTQGQLQTTWAGYNFNDNAIRENRTQFCSYVLSAETAWNGGTLDSDRIPYSFNEAFTRLYGDSLIPKAATKGWKAIFDKDISTIELRNLGISIDKPTSGSLIYRFGYSKNSPSLSAIPLSGCYNSLDNTVASIDIDVQGEETAKLFFVVSTPFSGSPTKPIAKTTILYDDLTTDTFDWIIGKNVLSLNDHRDLPSNPTYARYVSNDDMPTVSIHGYIYEPKKKPIKKIVFDSLNSGPELLVFDIMGLQ